MQYPVRTERSNGTPIAVVRRRAPAHQLSRVVPEACGTVWNVIKALGVVGAGRHVAVYLGSAGGQIDIEIGAEVAGPIGRHGEVVESFPPAGATATAPHLCPHG